MAELERVHMTKNADALHVVFIHGLGGDAKKTWMHNPEDEATLLPKWIGEDLDCHAWCLGYDAAISRWSDNAMPIPDQGKAVLNALNVEPELSKGNVVLVGHSMGGLVIKEALLSAAHKQGEWGVLLSRVIGQVFIATPHQGSPLAQLASALKIILPNPQVKELAQNSANLRDLNERFIELFHQKTWKALVLTETHPVKAKKNWLTPFTKAASVMVVDQNSADPHLNGVLAIPCPEDHFSIAKPKSKKETLYKTIQKFLVDVSTPPSPNTPAPPTPPATPPPTLKAKPLQSNDVRLQPRESKVYGREKEIAQVVAFLRGGDAAPSTQEITGTGGIGKTELCKAALKQWLKEESHAVAYYVTVPDRGSLADLITNLAAVIGATQIESPKQLLAVLPPALYYLDNLESVAECTEGQQFLRNLKETSGVRLLVSSRLDSRSIFGKSLSLGVLPDVAALALFRNTWAGQPLPDEAAFRDFVLKDLGAHALSITITARLGDCYAFGELVERWRSIGTQVAADVGDESRLGNLNTSLRLTAQVLGQTAGSLELWMLSALFPSGVPREVLQQFEQLGGWDIAARQLLVRHHVLAQRGECWHMLPPLARYALEASQKEEAGFAWTQCHPLARAVLDARLEAVDSIASTPEALAAREWVVRHFDAIAQTMRHEIGIKERDIEWLSNTHSHLINVYQFQPLLARDLLRFLDKHQIAQASVKQRLGDLERRLGQLDTARSLYEQALKLYQSERDELGQANTLKAQGDLERRLESDLGQLNTARSLYEQALKLYQSERDELGQANTLKAQGDLERRLGQMDTARDLYKQALKLFKTERNGLGQANTLQVQGDLLREAQQWPDAVQSYQTALALYRQEQDPMGLAYTCAELARCFHALDQYPLRDQALKDALVWAVKSNTPIVELYVQEVKKEING